MNDDASPSALCEIVFGTAEWFRDFTQSLKFVMMSYFSTNDPKRRKDGDTLPEIPPTEGGAVV
jgi:hypothetical protein